MASGGSAKVTPQGRGSRRLTLQGSLAAVDGTLREHRSQIKQIVKKKGSRRERGDVEGAQGLEVLVTKYCGKANIFTERSGRGILVDVGPSCASANHRLK